MAQMFDRFGWGFWLGVVCSWMVLRTAWVLTQIAQMFDRFGWGLWLDGVCGWMWFVVGWF